MKDGDMKECFSKVHKYTLVGTKPDKFYPIRAPNCNLISLRKGNEVYVFSPDLQSKEWNEAYSEASKSYVSGDLWKPFEHLVYGLELGKLEAIMVYDGEGEFVAIKRWNKEGQLIKDYLKGEYNRHNFGEPIQP